MGITKKVTGGERGCTGEKNVDTVRVLIEHITENIMSDFTTLLPYGLTRAQKVAHEHTLEEMRALITDIGTLRSLVKRVGLKLEVLDTAIDADNTGGNANLADLTTIVSAINTQLGSFQTWVEGVEADYTGSV